MKTASFSHTGKYGTNDRTWTIYGNVTLKDDGKTSVSLQNPSHFSPAQRYQAKSTAEAIVKADFKHPAITSFKESNNSIVTILKSYTEDLKKDYINKCKKWASNNYDKSVKWLDKVTAKDMFSDGGWYSEKWYKTFGIETEILTIHGVQNQHLSYKGCNDRNGYGEYHKKYIKSKDKIQSIKDYVRKGKEAAIQLAEKMAERHYEDSIQKLALRVESKGMNVSKMEVKKSGIGVNIELVLSDGKVTINAWTIVASGAIQRPHYRYLVK